MKLFFAPLIILVSLLQTARGQNAPVARVAAIQRVTEKSAGGLWQKVGVGTALTIGERFRTGKRSKADLKFTDGSLLRLGQLSSVEIRAAKGVTLLSGQLLFSQLSPGRVLAGTGAAEIKGSVGIVTLLPDGSAEFSLFSGAVEVSTARASVDLPPGFWVRALPDGTLSSVQPAPPLRFSFGAFLPEINQEASAAPLTGSQRNRRLRLSPERTALDAYNPNPELRQSLPFGSEPQSGGPPLPEINTQNLKASRAMPGREAAQEIEVPTTSRAVNHIGESDAGLGHFSGFDYALLGAVSDEGGYAAGGRLRGFRADGRLYAEIGALPLRVRWRENNAHRTRDFSAVNLASLTYRNDRYDVQVGRQRFVSGPTQATLFGSLLRPGGREVMDAIRFEPNLGKGRTLEVAYLHDAFVRNLPFRAGGAQRGAMARAGVETRSGNFGVNALKYFDLPGRDVLGASLDWSLPVVRDQIELYGEAGRDPFRRSLLSVGAYFPVVHDRTGVDLFVEYARLKARGGVAGSPNELAVRAYKPLNRNVYMVLGASHFYGRESSVTLGLSVGGRSYHCDAP